MTQPTYKQLVANNFALQKEVITLSNLTKELLEDLNTQFIINNTLNIELKCKNLELKRKGVH